MKTTQLNVISYDLLSESYCERHHMYFIFTINCSTSTL